MGLFSGGWGIFEKGGRDQKGDGLEWVAYEKVEFTEDDMPGTWTRPIFLLCTRQPNF